MLLQTQDYLSYFYFGGIAFVGLLLCILVLYAWLHQRKVNHFHWQLQQEEIAKQRAVFTALHEGEEKERLRISQELHDGINAKLIAIKSKTIHVADNTADKAMQHFLKESHDELTELMTEIRFISHHLQPAFSKNRNLQQAIAYYVERLNLDSKCRYTFLSSGELNLLNEVLQLHCYRIITELLQNIRKHAQATEASIELNVEEDANVQLIVIDNGKGIAPDKPTIGIGLINLRNRIEQCEGDLHIDSSNQGTTIIINLPLKALL